MKVYRIDYDTRTHGLQVEWIGSRVEAAVSCKLIQKEGFLPRARAVHVPTEKAELLVWLNAHGKD
jgi:hypothetical protein